MTEKGGAVRRFLTKVPILGRAARWLYRLVTTPGRIVRVEQQNDHVQERLTQILAQSAHAIRRTDERLGRIELRLTDLATELSPLARRAAEQASAEESLARLEAELRSLTAQAASPAESPGRVAAIEKDLRRLESELRGLATRTPGSAPTPQDEESARFKEHVGRALADLSREAVQVREKLSELDARLRRPLLDVIRELYTQQEPYQPLYGCPVTSPEPRRPCLDRAQAIERALDADIRGLRLLDLGASLGYFSFYFAERGAHTTGIDMNPAAVTLSRRVAEYNGLPSAFHQAEVSLDFIRGISSTEFDIALVLSVLHHVVHARGLVEAQTLMADLCARVPLVFVELATRREDVTHPWRESLPDDPAAVFERCEDVEIAKIGEFPTHLSDVRRPIYRLRRRSIVVNGVRYAVDRATPFSYAGAEAIGKTFLFGPAVFAKRLRPREGPLARENLRQALREVANYENLRGRSARFPVLKDYSIAPEEVLIVFERLEAENLVDLLERGGSADAKAVFDGVLAGLADLRAHGLYHNDVRVWNVMIATSGRGPEPSAKAGVTLIDLGHAEPEETDDTRAALLWLLRDLGSGRVTRNIGWPLKEPPSRQTEDYAPALREIAGRLLAARSFDEFLKGQPT